MVWNKALKKGSNSMMKKVFFSNVWQKMLKKSLRVRQRSSKGSGCEVLGIVLSIFNI